MPSQIEELMRRLKVILEQHPMVDASEVPLRFTNIAPESFDLEIFAYVLTADYNEYLKIQSDLLLRFLEASAALNIGFAVPIQESFSGPIRNRGSAPSFSEALSETSLNKP